MLILGIDPGFAITGWGVISNEKNKTAFIAGGVITTPAKMEFVERLAILHKELVALIKKHQPDQMAVEELFFAKNVTTALQVGQARGVILLTAIENKIPVREFTPLQIKQALTGYGRADKTQMQKMVKAILNLKTIPRPDDAADALACAICAAQSQNFSKNQ